MALALLDSLTDALMVCAMQSTISLEIKVGLLLVTGLIALVVLILVSDRVDLDTRYQVDAYLPAADGLLVGSPVTLAGIRIGKVSSIEPDPSGRNAIRVGMSILSSYDIPDNATLTLATAGILGDAYLAFALPIGPPGAALAKDGSATLDGNPGFFTEISEQARQAMGSVNQLLDESTRNDVQRLLKSSADTMEQSAELLSGLNARQERLDGIMDRVDGLLDRGTTTLQQIGDSGEETLRRAQALMGEVEQTMNSLAPALTATLGDVQTTVQRVDQALADAQSGLPVIMADTANSLRSLSRIMTELEEGRGVLGQLLRSHSLARDLNAVAIDLANAAEVIADRPSVLVWGQGEDETAASRAARQSLRQRRAFMEGYTPGAQHEEQQNEQESPAQPQTPKAEPATAP